MVGRVGHHDVQALPLNQEAAPVVPYEERGGLQVEVEDRHVLRLYGEVDVVRCRD